MQDLDNIKKKLINNFLRIAKIPRESVHEEKIAEFFINIAKEKKIYYFKDENNNVLIKKKGNTNSEPIAIQAHLDMVCRKSPDSNHNFQTEGIDVIFDGDKVNANDTTLGADQGVGLAIMLTIIEGNNLQHPDLEFIFTTEEETTFNGAVTFPYSKVESKRLINLDNSKDDNVVIGSVGDICNEYSFFGNLIKNNYPSYKILLYGYTQGSSSENIKLSKNNAITTMAKILNKKDILLKSIKGGESENDLAAFCEVVINTSLDVYSIFKDFNVKIEKIDNQICFSESDTQKIIKEILELECGYIKENKSFANLGKILTLENIVKINYVFRSMEETELYNIDQETRKLNNNFKVQEVYKDSIWNPNKNSKMLELYKKVYSNEYKIYPKEEICSGTIECSAIKKRINNVDIISIGATMENIHSIKETTYVSSWVKIYKLLVKLLEEI